MMIKVLKPFYDRAAGMIKREAGEVYEADADRAEELARRGLVTEEPEKKEEPEDEPKEQTKKRTRKKAAPEE